MSESPILKDARSIHDAVLTLDAHLDFEVTFFRPEQATASGFAKLASLEKVKAGGLGAAFFVAGALLGPLTTEGYRHAYDVTVDKINTMHRMADGPLREQVGIARHPDDVIALHRSGRIAAVIAVEGGYPLADDIGRLRELYALGARYLTLTHVGHNQLCDSKWAPGAPQELHCGLSAFGREVVNEMNRLGFMIDVSHISKSSLLDVCRLSQAPVMVSHSAVASIGGVGNVLDDEELAALKANGGVIHIVGLRRAIKADSAEKTQAVADLRARFDFPTDFWPFWLAFHVADAQRREAYDRRLEEIEDRYGRASVHDLVDHIDYVVKHMGIDHVGISSDFYNYSYSLDGWRDAAETPNVTRELVRRGYSLNEIGQIWSGNILRVWTEAEAAASRPPE